MCSTIASDSADPVAVLLANDRHDTHFDESSFAGRLHDECIFDPVAYEAFERAIVDTMASGPTYDDVGVIIRVLGHVLRLMRADVDQSDTFSIRNLDRDGRYDLNDRIHVLLFEVSCGRAPNLFDWPIPSVRKQTGGGD